MVLYIGLNDIPTDMPTQDPELMEDVRLFEPEGLKSVPQHRKNLNPVS